MKAWGKRTILKVGKIKVAREVNINTDSTKKLNPVLATRRTRGVPGLEFTLQLCSQGPRKWLEKRFLSQWQKWTLFLCKGLHACTSGGLSTVWTSSLNGIYFPKYTNPVVALIKRGVTNTAQTTERMPASPVPLVMHFPVIYNVQHSRRLALHGQGKVSNSQVLGLGGSMPPPEGPSMSSSTPGIWSCTWSCVFQCTRALFFPLEEGFPRIFQNDLWCSQKTENHILRKIRRTCAVDSLPLFTIWLMIPSGRFPLWF